jgi:ribonuclease HII
VACSGRLRTVQGMKHADFVLENELWAKAEGWIVACDEVGRGAYAGPVTVGACAVLPELALTAPFVADSKLLSRSRREALVGAVLEWAPCATGSASAAEIDEFGMAQALRIAAGRALDEIVMKCGEITWLIQDGVASWLPEHIVAAGGRVLQPKLDMTSATCAAASIVAKVQRDEVMRQLGTQYPDWPAIATSAGYGTKAHEAQIKEHGLCPEHRTSWSFATRLCPRDVAEHPRAE